jgi:hypothetical protein
MCAERIGPTVCVSGVWAGVDNVREQKKHEASLSRPMIRPGAGGQWRDQSSAHRFLHERADFCLYGGGQPLQREGDRPQGIFVEVRRVAEA